MFLVLVTDASVGRVLGGAQIVPEKDRESFLLSKNVCWCWLRMLLLAEYVPATILDPKALGTAFDVKKNKKVRMELHILTFIEQCSGLQGRRRCLAAGVLDIWHGPDHKGTTQRYLAWHGYTTSWHGTARGAPELGGVHFRSPFRLKLNMQPIKRQHDVLHLSLGRLC